MKIFPVSDMYLEFHHQFLPPYRGVADVVVCAGDMHTKGRAPKLLRMIFDHQEIIYIAGNHEYYGSSIEEQDELLRKECKKDGIHHKDITWLHEQSVQKPKKLVVVTHHGPSIKSLHPAYAEDIVSCGFASALDDLVDASRANYWISVHSHCVQNFKIGQTQVYPNCRGYPTERIDGFDPWLILEL